jgi:hypothetical protein
MSIRLDHMQGTSKHAVMTGRITAVKVHDENELPKPLPKVGQLVRLRLAKGVITESVTGLPYCSDRTTRAEGLVCGA